MFAVAASGRSGWDRWFLSRLCCTAVHRDDEERCADQASRGSGTPVEKLGPNPQARASHHEPAPPRSSGISRFIRGARLGVPGV